MTDLDKRKVVVNLEFEADHDQWNELCQKEATRAPVTLRIGGSPRCRVQSVAAHGPLQRSPGRRRTD